MTFGAFRGSRSLLASAAFADAMLVAGAARSQATQDPRLLFEQGVHAIEENRFSDAIIALEASQRIRTSPVTTYNLGLAYRGVGRLHDAIREFEAYLLRPARSATPELLAQIQQTLSACRSALVTVDVGVEPADAALRINGQSEARRRFTVDPGDHIIEASAPTYRTETRRARFAPGSQQRIQLVLVRTEGIGRLRVEPSTDRAVVSVDGTRVGVGTVELPVSEGEHRVRVEAVGFEARERTVRVMRDERSRIEVTLAPRGRSSATPWVVAGVVVGALVVGGAITIGVVASQGQRWEYRGENALAQGGTWTESSSLPAGP